MEGSSYLLAEMLQCRDGMRLTFAIPFQVQLQSNKCSGSVREMKPIALLTMRMRVRMRVWKVTEKVRC